MCGIAGFFTTSSCDHRAALAAMTDAVRHRGPDDQGYWCDPHTGLHLGHNRLSILDVSAAGHQPMLSQRERFVITFNGEIYNYQALQRALEHLEHTFKGTSDTEVMLAAFEQWGVPSAVERLNGMFAFALWDRFERRLYLARDRMGEKPLYYGWNSGMFLFASELKAMKAHPLFAASVDRHCAALALRYSYIPAPWSIYHNIFKLIPGTILELSPDNLATIPYSFSPHPEESAATPHPRYFWKPPGLIALEPPRQFSGTLDDAASQLDLLLSDAVDMRMVSDVPLGAFLSGGIDSSLIVALMQKHAGRPVKTFSIGFDDPAFNEAPHAKEIAAHLGTDHTELYVSSRDIFDVIPRLPTLYDEPFGDSSQIPTYLLSTLCRESVTVALSGDGGDELFAGYNRYTWAASFWSCFRYAPLFMRTWLSHLVGSRSMERRSIAMARCIPFQLCPHTIPQKLGTFANVIRASDRRDLYDRVMSHWPFELGTIPNVIPYFTIFQSSSRPQADYFINEMMAIDLQTYLPDDIMVKVDRASMAVSLEARTPFLDHRVVEFALSLPLSLKIMQRTRKAVLKRVLARYVPERLLDRPKMGFSIPIGKWLRTDLRGWAEELLSSASLESTGLLNPEPIRTRWKQHLASTHNWEHQLWDVLMLQSWLK